MVAAKPAAPPSARSSRATLVITACSSPSVRTASATRRGLVGVERERLAGVDQAEAARTRAAVAEDHERGGAVGPALVDVRAAGFLAHGVEVELRTSRLSLAEVVAEVGLHPHPLGPARPGPSTDSCTPASASRPSSRTGRLDAVAGSLAGHRRGERARGRRGARATRRPGARPTSAPTCAANRATTASTTARISGASPSTAAIDVTPRSRMPHGTMWSNIARSGSTLSAKPCTGATARDLHADGGDLLVAHPHAGVAVGSRCASMPKSASASMSTSSSCRTYATTSRRPSRHSGSVTIG